jgi:hypothetical protein
MLSRISSMLNPFSMPLIIWMPDLPKIFERTEESLMHAVDIIKEVEPEDIISIYEGILKKP